MSEYMAVVGILFVGSFFHLYRSYFFPGEPRTVIVFMSLAGRMHVCFVFNVTVNFYIDEEEVINSF